VHAQALRWHCAALGVQLSCLSFIHLYRKAGFNQGQPRHPKGTPEGGRWSGGSGNSEKPTEQDAFPHIPSERPLSAQVRNKIIKEVAKWALKATLRETTMGPVVGTLLNAMEIASWLQRRLSLHKLLSRCAQESG
jgi:hypothetical protein